MRVLLTGSSGWLGRYLAPMLQAAGHECVGLDIVPGAYTQIIASVADRTAIDQAFADYRIEAVIHAGALHKPDIARNPAQAFIDTNVSGTLNLLEAAIAAGHDRFVFTSTTSLMIRADVRAGKEGGAQKAWWLDEEFGPLRPRNIYGVTKLAAEHLCRLYHELHGLDVAILRTGRFFPEDDDTHNEPSGENLKANEFLNRRLTVEDAARAHVTALGAAPGMGCETYILSAPPPFGQAEAAALIDDAPAVIARHFPDAADIYARRGWTLPPYIDRVYDPSKFVAHTGFRFDTDFATILNALQSDGPLPYAHDPDYVSPIVRR